MIILDHFETEYLLKLLKKQDPFWARDKLIQKIQDDIDRKEKIKECDHTPGVYKGKKTCCTKCGGYAPGHGIEWSLTDESPSTEIQDFNKEQPDLFT